MTWVTRARPKTDRLACPLGLGGLDVETDDHVLLDRAKVVYDALSAWCQQQTRIAEAARHNAIIEADIS